MNALDKLPPQAPEMETNVLGAMLIDPEAAGIAVEMLEPDDFYKGSHRRIFEVARELYDNTQSLDQSLLRQTLSDRGVLEEVGGLRYIAELAASVATSAYIEQYARIVKDRSIARKLISVGSDIVRDGFEPGRSSLDLLEMAENRIMEIGQRSVGEIASIGDAFRPVLEKLSEQRGKGMVTGLQTGLRDLDAVTGGFHPGEFNIIAGRPSTGKTSLSMSIMHNLACERRIPVGFFSLEMSKDQVAKNMACMITRVNSWKLRSDKLSNDEWNRIQVDASEAMARMPMMIDDSPDSRVVQIRARARRMKNRHNIELLVIDYLQLICSERGSRQSRQEEISEISRSLKGLARELNIPVVALCQLNRKMEERNDHRPQLSDLRESGSLEQDADQVVLIYRPGLYDDPPNREKPVTLIIAKNRNGPVQDVQASFQESYFKYENYAPPGLMEPRAPEQERVPYAEPSNEENG